MNKLTLILSLCLTLTFFLFKVDPTLATGVSDHDLGLCTSTFEGNIYKGGFQLFNGDDYSGGDRIGCTKMSSGSNYTFGQLEDINLSWDNRSSNDTIFDDIWGDFNYKAESLKVRAAPRCKTVVTLYNSKAHFENNNYFGIKSVDRLHEATPLTLSFNISEEHDNDLVAIQALTFCD